MSQLEQWRPVPGEWGSHYAVSDQGRVRRQISGQGTRAGRVLRSYRTPSGLGVNLTQMVSVPGYGWVQVTKRCLVHRLVYEAFVGPCAGRVVRARDGDPCNARLGNLVASDGARARKAAA